MSYTVDLISRILSHAGPRQAGSKAEHKAQEFFKQELAGFCDTAQKEDFSCSLRAKFGSLKILVIAYVLAVLLTGIAIWGPVSPEISNVLGWAGFALALLNAFAFFTHFVSYRHWMDSFFPKMTSSNVTGTIEPTGEVKATLLVSGHMDSTPEFQWWYKLGEWGARIMVIMGFMTLLLPVGLGVALLLNGESSSLSAQLIVGFFALLSPLHWVFFTIHGKQVVDGAIDNLSGIAVAAGVGKELSGQRLKHTRVRVLGFGSEEVGLRGSTDYVRTHFDSLQAENAHLINVDTILAKEFISIVKSEPSAQISYDPALREGLAETFKQKGLEVPQVWLPIGATDGVPWRRAGLPAVSIIGLPSKGLHPVYHTREDSLDKVDGPCLEFLVDTLTDYARTFDEKLV